MVKDEVLKDLGRPEYWNTCLCRKSKQGWQSDLCNVTALQRELTNGALVGKLFIEKTKLRRKESSSGGPLSIYSPSLVA
jgi:hypothetical protein